MKDDLLLEDAPFELLPEFDEELAMLAGETGAIASPSSANRNSPAYIRWVQESLNRILGLRLTTDGRMSPQTRSAIRSFQQRQRLAVDGIAGPRTVAGLRAALATPSPSTADRFSPDAVLDRFAFDSDTLQPHHRVRIQEIARRVVASQGTSRPITAVRLVGHTDAAGAEAYNIDLGRRRAEQVRRAVVPAIDALRTGLSATLPIEVKTIGEALPTGRGAAADRRVEVILSVTPRVSPPPTDPRTRWFTILPGGTHGNEAIPLIRGAITFRSMLAAIRTAKQQGHYIYLLAWWLSDNLRLDPADPGSTIQSLFSAASRNGVQVRACLWDQCGKANTREATRISDLANGAAILDNDTLGLGSHHQKVLIVKGDQGLIAFCGGIDINPDRVRTVLPRSDPASFYCGSAGTRGTPMHDVHCRVRGPAAHHLLQVFLQRWYAHPQSRQIDHLKGAPLGLCEPFPAAAGRHYIRIATTSNNIRFGSCARDRSLQNTMISAIRAARRSIYIEDQYLVNMRAAEELRAALPQLQWVRILIPHSSISDLPQAWLRRKNFIDRLMSSPHRGKVRVLFLRDAEGNFGPFTYVHSKTWIIDGEVAIIGSANCNRRGWSHDSEVIAAIVDPKLAGGLQRALWQLHKGRLFRYHPNAGTDTAPGTLFSWDREIDPVEGERLSVCQPTRLPVCPQRISRPVRQRETGARAFA